MIVLFGGTGRVGSATVRALLSGSTSQTTSDPRRSGHPRQPLRVFTRRPGDVDFGPEVELFEGDVDDPAAVREALDGASRVFLASAAHPDMLHREASIIRNTVEAGAEGLVKISGTDGLVDSRSRSLAMRHHAASEELLRSSGLRWAILRPSAYIQTLMEQIAPFLRDRRRFALPGGNNRYSFIDVRDIGDFAAAILTGDERWDRTHVLTGPEAFDYDDLARLLSKELGEAVTYRPQTLFMARMAINQQIHYPYARFEAADLLSALVSSSGDAPTDTVTRVLGRPPRTVEAWIHENLELLR